ncbi:hypothetical protein GGR56DRAFT_493283 [Xylariaceae sp. FL0804]|nr:hypothetical protein GGR56DRAFT_493283 [Xylariaceae sp. FL0804]
MKAEFQMAFGVHPAACPLHHSKAHSLWPPAAPRFFHSATRDDAPPSDEPPQPGVPRTSSWAFANVCFRREKKGEHRHRQCGAFIWIDKHRNESGETPFAKCSSVTTITYEININVVSQELKREGRDSVFFRLNKLDGRWIRRRLQPVQRPARAGARRKGGAENGRPRGEMGRPRRSRPSSRAAACAASRTPAATSWSRSRSAPPTRSLLNPQQHQEGIAAPRPTHAQHPSRSQHTSRVYHHSRGLELFEAAARAR